MKLYTSSIILHALRIEEQIPLKQGLKHGKHKWIGRGVTIEEQIPLKQGLKPEVLRLINERFGGLKSKFH